MSLVLWSLDNVSSPARQLIPMGIFLLITAVLIAVRHVIYSILHRRARRTQATWDDILIKVMRPVSLLWCIWLGIYTAVQFVSIPPFWLPITQKAIPAIFIAMGVYTATVAIVVFTKWYSKTIASQTQSKLDDIIINILKIGIPLCIGFIGLIFILNILGVNVEIFKTWLGLHGLNLVLILAIGIIFLLVATALIPRLIQTSITRIRGEENEDELKKRKDTLVSVLTAVTQLILITGTILMVLSELKINIATILAGVGVAGIALGFGAQSLVKDVIAGLFIIFENQYSKGDVVKIADVSGSLKMLI